MTYHNPSDRVQLREVGQLRSPGSCALCGNGTCVEGYVDLDIYYEWEGNVYLCMNCIKDVCRTVGALLPAEAEHLKEVVESLGAELKDTKEKLNAFAELDAALSALGHSFSTANADDAVNPDLPVEESAAEPVNTPDPVSAANSGESEPKRPTPRRRPNDASRAKSSNEPSINI